jgi:pyruvate/2-oxoglutarate dehydrogenase complex dihydrolipoamide dehydrogenase (E3) component
VATIQKPSFDIIVIGSGPAGVTAARRAAELGARTALIEQHTLGGMATLDGPVPIRTLAHAARLVREARQLSQYGLTMSELTVDYRRLLDRVHAVVAEVGAKKDVHDHLVNLGVAVYDQTGAACFENPHEITTASGLRLCGEKFILCVGGRSRPLPIPGIEHAVTHSHVWSLTEVPASLVIIGAGATGVQVASIFAAFGSQVTLLEVGPRILMAEDVEVAEAVQIGLERNGIDVYAACGGITSIEAADGERRVRYGRNGEQIAIGELVILAAGWVANTDELQLERACVEVTPRGYIRINDYLQTTAPHIFAAGDADGNLMLVPGAVYEGYTAATAAVHGVIGPFQKDVMPVGSFTDPEYGSVGINEGRAREAYDVIVSRIDFEHHTRCIIDGRTFGFCKVIVDRDSHRFLGAHVVGERAVETVQIISAAMQSDMRVEEFAIIPFSFPTYGAVVGLAAYDICRQLGLTGGRPEWATHRILY